jgi:transcriptional regulator with XRE-family HTH domain
LLNLLSNTLDTDQAFGQALRSLRTKRKWSQTDLALRAAVDRNYISLIELGKSSPSLGMVYRLCDALDVRPTEVLKDVEKRLAREPGSK